MSVSPPNRIAAFRETAGLTQGQLGEKVGAHWVTISRLERGDMRLTLDWMARIAPALGVCPADLIDEPGRAARHAREGEFITLGDAMNAAIAKAAGTWASDPNISDSERARREILTLRWQIEQLQARIVERERIIFTYEDEINDRRARAWVEGIEAVPTSIHHSPR
ncbi:hypothetical protein CHELA1G11_10632 [Hyphomicrobiales bacterium]|nr:hypothetical protein CHELA1G11_10632 [Hyphomicrobiales bacterium]CAH1673315.1 hypothetical protein CHELA1G2_13672 [Hyphomicrobiales bacterium]